MTPAQPQKDICVNCRLRPATMNWVGEGGVLAYTHGLSVRWCDYCAAEAQLAFARKMAAQIPELEQKVAASLQAGVPQTESEKQ